eukprot:333119_1
MAQWTGEDTPVKEAEQPTTVNAALSFSRRRLIYDSMVNSRSSTRGDHTNDEGLGHGTQIYTWGVGYYGQLGRKGRFHEKCAKVPTVVEFPHHVLQVSCGGYHTAVLTGAGDLYTFGDGRHGELGNLDRKHTISQSP